MAFCMAIVRCVRTSMIPSVDHYDASYGCSEGAPGIFWAPSPFEELSMCILSLIDCFKEKCALSPILAFLLSRYISKKKKWCYRSKRCNGWFWVEVPPFRKCATREVAVSGWNVFWMTGIPKTISSESSLLCCNIFRCILKPWGRLSDSTFSSLQNQFSGEV